MSNCMTSIVWAVAGNTDRPAIARKLCKKASDARRFRIGWDESLLGLGLKICFRVHHPTWDPQ